MTWTQPLCGRCWDEHNPGRHPSTVIDHEIERCCLCGRPTSEGIFTRLDPRVVPYPRVEGETEDWL